jgi:Ca2+:H+ antiporter
LRRALELFDVEDRVLGVLLVLFVPATLLGSRLGWPGWVVFFLSVGAVIPLAGFIGAATEALADRIGARAGGLLNATFGNAPDLLIGIFGVQRGLIPLVKATLIGALISNSALIMGSCYIVAGLRYGRPRFRRREAGNHSVLMLLTLAAVLFPTAGSMVLCGGDRCADAATGRAIQSTSIGVAVVLLLVYIAYVGFGIFGWERLRMPAVEGFTGRDLRERGREGMGARWPVALSVGVLVVSALLVIPVTDILTGTVQSVVGALGWSQVFIGMVIVANAGNVAEGYAALRLAFSKPAEPDEKAGVDSGVDLALGIASASSIQIATFVAPIIVLFSLFVVPMNLSFPAVEVAILGLLVLVFNYIAHDGETNWLEGAELVGLYAMAAVIFYALPEKAFA